MSLFRIKVQNGQITTTRVVKLPLEMFITNRKALLKRVISKRKAVVG